MGACGVSEKERVSGEKEYEGIILISLHDWMRESVNDRVNELAIVKAEVRPKQEMREHLSPSQGPSQQHQTSNIYLVMDRLTYAMSHLNSNNYPPTLRKTRA